MIQWKVRKKIYHSDQFLLEYSNVLECKKSFIQSKLDNGYYMYLGITRALEKEKNFIKYLKELEND